MVSAQLCILIDAIVQARHAGKTYTVQADATATGIALKQSIYEVTGVPTGM